MELTLKGLVVSKFGSAGGLAMAVNWSGRKARDIVSGRQIPTAKDMDVLAEALELDTPEAFCIIFFPNRVHNVDTKAVMQGA